MLWYPADSLKAELLLAAIGSPIIEEGADARCDHHRRIQVPCLTVVVTDLQQLFEILFTALRNDIHSPLPVGRSLPMSSLRVLGRAAPSDRRRGPSVDTEESFGRGAKVHRR